MKNRTTNLALLVALSALTTANASEFSGSFIGANIGAVRTEITGPLGVGVGAKDATTLGIDGGHNWDVKSFLVGIDVYADSNFKVDGISSNAYGLDLKLGLPQGNWLPYARLGYAHTAGSGTVPPITGGGFHGGLGIEYKFAPSWGVNAEWQTSSVTNNGSKLNNDSIGLGLHYYFEAPKAAPFPVAVVKAAEPAPAPKPAPVIVPVAPAPVAEPAYVPPPAPVPVAEPAPVPQPKKVVVSDKLINLDGANFATNSATLLKGADKRLNEVVIAAKQNPDAKFEVSGHTDSRGKKASNQKLSENRAASVQAWLVKHGVASARISTAGYADTKPIADNKTPSGRAANRRVEVRYTVKE